MRLTRATPQCGANLRQGLTLVYFSAHPKRVLWDTLGGPWSVSDKNGSSSAEKWMSISPWFETKLVEGVEEVRVQVKEELVAAAECMHELTAAADAADAAVGPGECCSPPHRMMFKSRNQG